MNKKKLAIALNIVGILVAVGGLALTGYEIYVIFAVKSESIMNNIIFAVIGGVLLVLGLILYGVGKNLKKNVCSKCGTILKLCDYEWVLEQLYNTYAPDNSFANQIASYKITAYCSKCGKPRVYHQDFIATDYRTGTQNNTQQMIEEWCKTKFGH